MHSCFSQIVVAFVLPDSYPMAYVTTFEKHGSCHQYPIAWENTANSSIAANLGNSYPYFSQNMGDSLPSNGLNEKRMVYFITREMQ